MSNNKESAREKALKKHIDNLYDQIQVLKHEVVRLKSKLTTKEEPSDVTGSVVISNKKPRIE